MLNSLELTNNGERLVPGYSHNLAEVVRHKSSYKFFKEIIEHDRKFAEPIRILEIGCGTGHGTQMLSDIPNCTILAIDVEEDAIAFANQHFSAPNITYKHASLSDIKTTEIFDYILSRHSFEHIENIFSEILNYKPRYRLMANVPYKEPPGNIYHVYLNIDESMFNDWPCPDFFYEDLDGVTYTRNDYANLNSIVCVSSFDSSLDKISDVFNFPFPPWKPNYLEELACERLPAMFRLEQTLTSTQKELTLVKQNLVCTEQELREAKSLLQIPLVRLSLGIWKLLARAYRTLAFWRK